MVLCGDKLHRMFAQSMVPPLPVFVRAGFNGTTTGMCTKKSALDRELLCKAQTVLLHSNKSLQNSHGGIHLAEVVGWLI